MIHIYFIFGKRKKNPNKNLRCKCGRSGVESNGNEPTKRWGRVGHRAHLSQMISMCGSNNVIIVEIRREPLSSYINDDGHII